MKVLWCWRCQQDIPMLDEREFRRFHQAFYSALKVSLPPSAPGEEVSDPFKEVLRIYNEMTGFKETNPTAIFHHRISLYGPPCITCGKPLRTPKARLCVGCGTPVRSRESEHSLATAEARVRWANDIVGEYADLLERKAGLWIPESALPASLEEVKEAIVITAADKFGKGLITKRQLDVYRSGYVSLAWVAATEDAHRANGLMPAVKAFKESPTQTDDKLVALLTQFAENASLFREEPSHDGFALWQEFDAALAKKLVAKPH